MNSPVRLGVSPTATSTPNGFSINGLRLYFPELEPWVVHSVLLPLRSPSLSVHECGPLGLPATASGDPPTAPCRPAAAWPALLHTPPPHWVYQPPSCLESSPPSCMSPPLLTAWMNVSSLTPWLSDFYTVRFSVSSGCFLFLNCCCPSFGRARRCSVSTYASMSVGLMPYSKKRFLFTYQYFSQRSFSSFIK